LVVLNQNLYYSNMQTKKKYVIAVVVVIVW